MICLVHGAIWLIIWMNPVNPHIVSTFSWQNCDNSTSTVSVWGFKIEQSFKWAMKDTNTNLEAKWPIFAFLEYIILLMENQLTFDKEWKSYLSHIDFFPVNFFNLLMSDEVCVPPNVSRNTTILEKYVGMHGKSCCCRLLKCSNFCMQVTCDASWNQLKICLLKVQFFFS